MKRIGGYYEKASCESVCILPLCMGESLLEIEVFGMGILLFFSSEDLIAIGAEE